jgi:hypothetical protein
MKNVAVMTRKMASSDWRNRDVMNRNMGKTDGAARKAEVETRRVKVGRRKRKSQMSHGVLAGLIELEFREPPWRNGHESVR